MNEIQRAIEDVESLSTAKSVFSNMFDETHGENLKLAVNAMKRQIPIKPVADDNFVGFDDEGNAVWRTDYFCGECNMGLEGEYCFCPYCGQSIDWTDAK